MELILGVENLFYAVGRDPVALTNPLVEPGRNFVLKYLWKY